MRVSPAQVLAFRLAGQRLHAPSADPLAALQGWAVQDSPPGTAALALAARTEPLAADWLDRALHVERAAVAIYNPRTATAILPADDVATFTAGLLAPDEAALRFQLGHAIPPEGEGTAAEAAVALTLAAVEEALDDGPLSRDALHAALRDALPADLLPWCRGCESHHARRGLLVAACLRGRLCLAGREGRQPLFARTDRWLGTRADPGGVDRDAAAAELVRRFLRGYGPATPQLLAQWAGISPAHARRSWSLVADELAEVATEPSGRAAWVLHADLRRLRGAGRPRGDEAAGDGVAAVRLLGPGDPLLLARDRELLIADPQARRRIWRAINGPGLALVGGVPRATWRGRRQGRRLLVELEPLDGALGAEVFAALEHAAERIAPLRGCVTATVTLAAAGR